MIARHLTDDEVQQYASDTSNCEPNIVEHVEQCDKCKVKAANYQLLFSEIKQQAVAVFDFNLSELVIAKLPSPKHRLYPENVFFFLMILATIVLTGAALSYFRSYLTSLFTSTTPLVIYLTVTTVITLSMMLSIDMHKNYQKKMKALDFY